MKYIKILSLIFLSVLICFSLNLNQTIASEISERLDKIKNGNLSGQWSVNITCLPLDGGTHTIQINQRGSNVEFILYDNDERPVTFKGTYNNGELNLSAMNKYIQEWPDDEDDNTIERFEINASLRINNNYISIEGTLQYSGTANGRPIAYGRNRERNPTDTIIFIPIIY
ncbi:hypothetical protein ACFL1N_09455 [Thermodesulfobacteriota bacterium]